VLGNFSSADVGGGLYEANDARVNPQSAQRVRGLVQAELTRNYFSTSIPFDTYNTSSVTVNRGPNSVLFGLGSPGGVIENSIKTPLLGTDFTEVSLRLSHLGGHRETLDLNRSLFNDRLGLRVALMNEDVEYRQEEAWEEDRRAFAALEWRLRQNSDSFFGNSTVRANFEAGRLKGRPQTPSRWL